MSWLWQRIVAAWRWTDAWCGRATACPHSDDGPCDQCWMDNQI